MDAYCDDEALLVHAARSPSVDSWRDPYADAIVEAEEGVSTSKIIKHSPCKPFRCCSFFGQLSRVTVRTHKHHTHAAARQHGHTYARMCTALAAQFFKSHPPLTFFLLLLFSFFLLFFWWNYTTGEHDFRRGKGSKIVMFEPHKGGGVNKHYFIKTKTTLC